MTPATFESSPPAVETMPESRVFFEIVNGEIRENPPMGRLASLVASVLHGILWAYVSQQRLGLTAFETLFRLSSGGPSRRPDLAFVAFDRMPTRVDTNDDPPQWEVVPNLTVEVVSPTNTSDEIEDKLIDYFRAGVQLVWVIHPRHRRIYVHESLDKVRLLLETDELVGDPAVPGFRLAVATLFEALAKPQ